MCMPINPRLKAEHASKPPAYQPSQEPQEPHIMFSLPEVKAASPGAVLGGAHFGAGVASPIVVAIAIPIAGAGTIFITRRCSNRQGQ